MPFRSSGSQLSLRGALCLPLLMGVVLSQACQRRATPAEAGARDCLNFAMPLQVPSALAILAQERGLLAEEGLDVTVQEYVSGARAMTALLAGEADATTAADVPVAIQSVDRADFCVVASLGSTGGGLFILARRDRGISTPADLRGKRVGTQSASALHFFLSCFCVKHGMEDSDVAVRFEKIEDLVPLLVAGRLDAISTREPFLSEGLARLGTNAVLFIEPGLYFRTEVMVVRRVFLDAHPRAVQKLLRGLIAAAQFNGTAPQEAAAAVARRLKTDESDVAHALATSDLTVGLDQALLIMLEDQARWAIRRRLTARKVPPNILNIVEASPLRKVQPETVTVAP